MNPWLWDHHSVRPKDGRFAGYIGAGVNIHDRKRAEEALRASERRLRAALEVTPVGIAFVDAQGKATLVNPKVREIWGQDEFGDGAHVLQPPQPWCCQRFSLL